MGSHRDCKGGRPFKAQATCGHIRPLGYFATRLEATLTPTQTLTIPLTVAVAVTVTLTPTLTLEAAVCYARWAVNGRDEIRRDSSSHKDEMRLLLPPRRAKGARPAAAEAEAEAEAGGTTESSGSHKQRRAN